MVYSSSKLDQLELINTHDELYKLIILDSLNSLREDSPKYNYNI